jgi:photosystem II stability/assembly factor-like uncharacterized protein
MTFRAIVLPIATLAVTACQPATTPLPAPTGIVATSQTSGTTAQLFAVSATDERTVWVSGASGTYVRTLDGGTTWQAGHVTGADSLQFRDVAALDADVAWLLAIGNGDQSRIYHTRNGGSAWVQQFIGSDKDLFLDCIAMWDARRGLVLGDAAHGEMVMLTTDDGGDHWTRVPPAQLPATGPKDGSFATSGTCLVTLPGGRAWITTGADSAYRVLRSTDYGRSWTASPGPVAATSLSFRDDGTGFAFTGPDPTKDGGVFVTRDAGRTWAAVTRPPIAGGVYGGAVVPGTRGPSIFAVAPHGAAFSTNAGGSWAPIDTNNYWGVGVASAHVAWAVGRGGRITKFTGF